MAHSFIITTLENLSQQAKTKRNPMEFLDGFSPVHYNWHRMSRSLRKLGFLLFHFEVIKNLNNARGPSIWGGNINAFSKKDFKDFGQPYDVSTSVQRGQIQTLEQFSFDIEQWHNEAHMAVGMAFNIMNDMMDPRANIYYKQFWQLHYFINLRFTAALKKFDPQGLTAAKVTRLMDNFHAEAGRI